MQLVRTARPNPNPPILIGRVANCWVSPSGWTSNKTLSVFQMPSSCAEQYAAQQLGGIVRIVWFALGLAL